MWNISNISDKATVKVVIEIIYKLKKILISNLF